MTLCLLLLNPLYLKLFEDIKIFKQYCSIVHGAQFSLYF